MKKVAILQSNYIPWKGYFDIINMVDEFVIYDDVQYTRRDWRNRNKIKTKHGLIWLTVPVEVKGKYEQLIKDTKVVDNTWTRAHWETIKRNYVKADCFKEYTDIFEDLYLKELQGYDLLSDINYSLIKTINEILGIKSKLTWSSSYNLEGDKQYRLLSICKQAGASEYISGPSAKNYISEDDFKNAGIKLTWMDYSNYSEYNQLYPPFEHAVSILDLVFNCGKDAKKYMKSFMEN